MLPLEGNAEGHHTVGHQRERITKRQIHDTCETTDLLVRGTGALPSLRSARRSPLSRVWNRSKESRGNGEEGTSQENGRALRFHHERERTHARPPTLATVFFRFLRFFGLFFRSLTSLQRT